MKKSLSILIIFALCVSLCTMLAGCGKGSMAQVYYLNFKPESAKAYEKIAAEYEAQTGVKVKVVTAAANTYEQTLKSEIAKKNAQTSCIVKPQSNVIVSLNPLGLGCCSRTNILWQFPTELTEKEEES